MLGRVRENMNHCGIRVDIKNKPELDPDFIPLHRFNEEFLKTATAPFSFAIRRNDEQISVKSTFVRNGDAHKDANRYYIERLVKTELWQKGGFKIYVRGDEELFQMLKTAYAPGGIRSFDAGFMAGIYQRDFEVVNVDKLPEPFEIDKSVGRHFNGCRIGLDVGGSDYKVSAVIDGETVYGHETVWHPKTNSDPDYHFNELVAALKSGMEQLPRVDAIGISSAGIIANNRVLGAQLFQMAPKELFDSKVRDIYSRAVGEIGDDIPFEVANDGDVTALAGSINLNKNNILGIAMGTSVAGGFVDKKGYIPNWLSELAFMPVDASPLAAQDSWTLDIGLGVQYFCQEAVIKLAKSAGIGLDGYETPALKLEAVQRLLADGHDGATRIFRSIGCYLGHTAPLYNDIYGTDAILLLGRVMSGEGGNIVGEAARKILKEEYPDTEIELLVPDEKTRRLGQSACAASLPELKK